MPWWLADWDLDDETGTATGRRVNLQVAAEIATAASQVAKPVSFADRGRVEPSTVVFDGEMDLRSATPSAIVTCDAPA